MRLDRYLANMGCGSRKEVKQLIRSGKVSVAGKLVKDEALPINAGVDEVNCDGVAVRYAQYIYLMLHKPAGVISATEDLRERTVLDLLPSKYLNKGLFPVGRLDKDTEGLLILTNHGELGHRLLAPKKHVPKRYFARIDGLVDAADQAAFRAGVEIGDYLAQPALLTVIAPGAESLVQVVIHEGKFHQIKRMFEARGKRVIYLKRLAMGELELDPQLALGEFRELTEVEIAVLLTAANLMS